MKYERDDNVHNITYSAKHIIGRGFESTKMGKCRREYLPNPHPHPHPHIFHHNPTPHPTTQGPNFTQIASPLIINNNNYSTYLKIQHMEHAVKDDHKLRVIEKI